MDGNSGEDSVPKDVINEEQKTYDDKLEEMQIYLQPLKLLIKKCNGESSGASTSYLERLKILHDVITTRRKAMKYSALLKCEQILKNIKIRSKKSSSPATPNNTLNGNITTEPLCTDLISVPRNSVGDNDTKITKSQSVFDSSHKEKSDMVIPGFVGTVSCALQENLSSVERKELNTTKDHRNIENNINITPHEYSDTSSNDIMNKQSRPTRWVSNQVSGDLKNRISPRDPRIKPKILPISNQLTIEGRQKTLGNVSDMQVHSYKNPTCSSLSEKNLQQFECNKTSTSRDLLNFKNCNNLSVLKSLSARDPRRKSIEDNSKQNVYSPKSFSTLNSNNHDRDWSIRGEPRIQECTPLPRERSRSRDQVHRRVRSFSRDVKESLSPCRFPSKRSGDALTTTHGNNTNVKDTYASPLDCSYTNESTPKTGCDNGIQKYRITKFNKTVDNRTEYNFKGSYKNKNGFENSQSSKNLITRESIKTNSKREKLGKSKESHEKSLDFAECDNVVIAIKNKENILQDSTASEKCSAVGSATVVDNFKKSIDVQALPFSKKNDAADDVNQNADDNANSDNANSEHIYNSILEKEEADDQVMTKSIDVFNAEGIKKCASNPPTSRNNQFLKQCEISKPVKKLKPDVELSELAAGISRLVTDKALEVQYPIKQTIKFTNAKPKEIAEIMSKEDMKEQGVKKRADKDINVISSSDENSGDPPKEMEKNKTYGLKNLSSKEEEDSISIKGTDQSDVMVIHNTHNKEYLNIKPIKFHAYKRRMTTKCKSQKKDNDERKCKPIQKSPRKRKTELDKLKDATREYHGAKEIYAVSGPRKSTQKEKKLDQKRTVNPQIIRTKRKNVSVKHKVEYENKKKLSDESFRKQEVEDSAKEVGSVNQERFWKDYASPLDCSYTNESTPKTGCDNGIQKYRITTFNKTANNRTEYNFNGGYINKNGFENSQSSENLITRESIKTNSKRENLGKSKESHEKSLDFAESDYVVMAIKNKENILQDSTASEKCSTLGSAAVVDNHKKSIDVQTFPFSKKNDAADDVNQNAADNANSKHIYNSILEKEEVDDQVMTKHIDVFNAEDIKKCVSNPPASRNNHIPKQCEISKPVKKLKPDVELSELAAGISRPVTDKALEVQYPIKQTIKFTNAKPKEIAKIMTKEDMKELGVKKRADKDINVISSSDENSGDPPKEMEKNKTYGLKNLSSKEEEDSISIKGTDQSDVMAIHNTHNKEYLNIKPIKFHAYKRRMTTKCKSQKKDNDERKSKPIQKLPRKRKTELDKLKDATREYHDAKEIYAVSGPRKSTQKEKKLDQKRTVNPQIIRTKRKNVSVKHKVEYKNKKKLSEELFRKQEVEDSAKEVGSVNQERFQKDYNSSENYRLSLYSEEVNPNYKPHITEGRIQEKEHVQDKATTQSNLTPNFQGNGINTKEQDNSSYSKENVEAVLSCLSSELVAFIPFINKETQNLYKQKISFDSFRGLHDLSNDMDIKVEEISLVQETLENKVYPLLNTDRHLVNNETENRVYASSLPQNSISSEFSFVEKQISQLKSSNIKEVEVGGEHLWFTKNSSKIRPSENLLHSEAEVTNTSDGFPNEALNLRHNHVEVIPSSFQTRSQTPLLTENEINQGMKIFSTELLPPQTSVVAYKESMIYQAMCSHDKLRHFYKCMGARCSFTTVDINEFAQHFEDHENTHAVDPKEDPNRGFWRVCAYCLTSQGSSEELCIHVRKEHGECTLQCAYCFYRAKSVANVRFHHNIAHQQSEFLVLQCEPEQNLPPYIEKPITELVSAFRCNKQGCNLSTYIVETFYSHKLFIHSEDLQCHECLLDFSTVPTLINHYREMHSIGLYQCLYCVHATATEHDMWLHLYHFHSNVDPKAIHRIGNARNYEGVVLNTEILRQIVFCKDQDELFKYIIPPPQSIEQKITPSKLSVHTSCQLNPKPDFSNGFILEQSDEADVAFSSLDEARPLIQPNGLRDIDENLTSLLDSTSMNPSKIFEMNSSATTSEPATVTNIIEEGMDGSFSDDPMDISEDKFIIKESCFLSLFTDVNTALIGDQKETPQTENHQESYFKCGNTGCSFDARTSSAMKNHLVICDMARYSPNLQCYHCQRHFKKVTSLVDHMRTHGPHRYSCSLCSFKAPLISRVNSHMKLRHQINMTMISPVDSQKQDGENDYFIVSPKVTEMKVPSLWKRGAKRPKLTREVNADKNGDGPLFVNTHVSGDVSNADVLDLKYGYFGKPDLSGAFKCPRCVTFISKNQQEMCEHIYIEIGYKPITCKICQISSTKRTMIMNHVNKVHGIEWEQVGDMMEINMNIEIESWVEKGLSKQHELIKEMVPSEQSLYLSGSSTEVLVAPEKVTTHSDGSSVLSGNSTTVIADELSGLIDDDPYPQ